MATGEIFIPGCQKSLYLHILEFHLYASKGTANFHINLQQSNAALWGATSNQSSWLSFQRAHSLCTRIPQKIKGQQGPSLPDSVPPWGSLGSFPRPASEWGSHPALACTGWGERFGFGIKPNPAHTVASPSQQHGCIT